MNNNPSTLLLDSTSPSRLVPKWFWGLPLFLSAALLLVYGLNGLRAGGPPHGERKEHSTGRDFAAQTDVQLQPRASATAPGFASERVWSGHDDWEPFVAADRSSSYVYQMTTRFNTRLSGIFIRRSTDGGEDMGPGSAHRADHRLAGRSAGAGGRERNRLRRLARWPVLDEQIGEVLRSRRDLDGASRDCSGAALDRSPVAGRLARWPGCLCGLEQGRQLHRRVA